MELLEVDRIESWHAHVYFDAASRETARALRAAIEARFAGKMEMGRFHERPVGPHPRWSYQVAFAPEGFALLVPWLALNRGDLVVFVHPNTADALADHRDHAIWLGAKLDLDLSVLK
ncbi:MAG: DOPA 4,5-dioxygenase family protein [Alphaproteobacteria bacterium]|nr:DOPA 4,5-dioxygenase family protein [Alphaproteobacteria bacterium]